MYLAGTYLCQYTNRRFHTNYLRTLVIVIPTSIGIRLFQLGLLGKAAFWLLEQKVLEQKPLPMLRNCPFGLGAKMSLNYLFIL